MYIYKTTNNLNNKHYIGLCTKNINESKEYYGSGLLLNRAINKYGKENFTKTILEETDSFGYLKILEMQYIDKYCSHIDGYNLTMGGTGGDTWFCMSDKRRKLASKRLSISQRKYLKENGTQIKSTWCKLSDDDYKKACKKLSDSKKKYFKTNPGNMTGKKQSDYFIKRIKEVNTGRKHKLESRLKMSKASKGKKKSKEHCLKNKIAKNKWYETNEAPMKGRVTCLDITQNKIISVTVKEFHKYNKIKYFTCRTKEYKQFKSAGTYTDSVAGAVTGNSGGVV